MTLHDGVFKINFAVTLHNSPVCEKWLCNYFVRAGVCSGNIFLHCRILFHWYDIQWMWLVCPWVITQLFPCKSKLHSGREHGFGPHRKTIRSIIIQPTAPITSKMKETAVGYAWTKQTGHRATRHMAASAGQGVWRCWKGKQQRSKMDPASAWSNPRCAPTHKTSNERNCPTFSPRYHWQLHSSSELLLSSAGGPRCQPWLRTTAAASLRRRRVEEPSQCFKITRNVDSLIFALSCSTCWIGAAPSLSAGAFFPEPVHSFFVCQPDLTIPMIFSWYEQESFLSIVSFA